jgi:hypothetical protein
MENSVTYENSSTMVPYNPEQAAPAPSKRRMRDGWFKGIVTKVQDEGNGTGGVCYVGGKTPDDPQQPRFIHKFVITFLGEEDRLLRSFTYNAALFPPQTHAKATSPTSAYYVSSCLRYLNAVNPKAFPWKPAKYGAYWHTPEGGELTLIKSGTDDWHEVNKAVFAEMQRRQDNINIYLDEVFYFHLVRDQKNPKFQKIVNFANTLPPGITAITSDLLEDVDETEVIE